MGLLIDTSVFIAVERQGVSLSAIESQFQEEDVFIAAVSASELLHGVHRADSMQRRGRRERFVEAVLSMIPIIAFDLRVAREHARIWTDLAQTGQQIGAHDLQIAATAVAHEHAILTANRREFERVEALRVVAWPA